MKKLRAVVDTNVFVSALLAPTGSPPDTIYRALKEQKFLLVSSPELLQEVEEVINRPHLVKEYRLSKQDRLGLQRVLRRSSLMVPGLPQLKVVKTDPKDDKFIACAVEGKADYIVTGDKHLLDFGTYQDIRIIEPRPFVQILG